MIQMRLALSPSEVGSPSSSEPSPGSARSEANAMNLPSGLHIARSSFPECVIETRPEPAFQSHRSRRKVLFFQSGDSVVITAADPSGASRASMISVVLKYSSSEIVGLDWENARAGTRQSKHASANHGFREDITELYLCNRLK